MLKTGPSLALLVLLTAGLAPGQLATNIQIGKPDQPIVGSPYTADQTVTTVRHLPDGILVTQTVQGHICRSADGVERYDGAFPSTDPAHPGTITIAYILDRARHTSITLNSNLKTAYRQALPEVAAVNVSLLPLPRPSAADSQIKPENPTTTDLGKRNLGMLEIHGALVTATIPAGKIGNSQPLPVTSELWLAPQEKIVVKQVEKNPLTGERTFELSNIRAEEPDPALFQIPEGYTVKDRPAIPATPPPPAASLSPTPRPPEQRTRQIEDALNNPDPGIKNDVAYGLALNRDHLADAQLLTEQAIPLKEQQIADVVSGGDPAKSFDQMVYLSRFWDTAGYVFYRAGHAEKAEPYLRAAWELNPNSLFAIHLGLAYESQHKNELALDVYRMALSARPSPAIQDSLMTALSRLGQPNAAPLPVDIVTPLPALTPQLDPNDDEPLVDIVLSHNHPPAVTLLKGKSALKKPLTGAIESALQSDLPDSGPELVIRRARVTCTAGAAPACSLHFTNTREFTTAEQARRDALRSPLP